MQPICFKFRTLVVHINILKLYLRVDYLDSPKMKMRHFLSSLETSSTEKKLVARLHDSS